MEIGLEDLSSRYPTIKKQNANSYYLGLVQNLYAGSEGELTSFLQTRYQYYIFKNWDDNMAELLRKISEQDLKHHEILSQIILSLSGNPKYIDAQNKWFVAREIDYVQGIKQVISYDIELKEKVVIDYKSTIQKISNSEIKSYLERILADELIHLEKLKNIYANL